MVLNFPNTNRAFDATPRAVRFWGYDSAMEVAFFVTEAARGHKGSHDLVGSNL
jgi:hypothetical protein